MTQCETCKITFTSAYGTAELTVPAFTRRRTDLAREIARLTKLYFAHSGNAISVADFGMFLLGHASREPREQ